MHLVICFLALVLVLILVCIFLYQILLMLFPPADTLRIRNPHEAQALLRTSTLGQRAPPNQGLVEAFDLNNSFTTTKEHCHHDFLAKVRVHLRTPDAQWKSLAASTARELTNIVHTSALCQSRLINATTLAQILTFRTVMAKFFPDIPQAPDTHIISITTRINTLWIASKDLETAHQQMDFALEKAELFQLLRTLFSDESIPVTSNPLNVLLPAYETLWRIVLRCFIEVRFKANGERMRDYATVFRSFLINPTPKALEIIHPNIGVSIKHIVNEALRLYPPTRSIHRSTSTGERSIDVEFLQRDPSLWGPQSEEFEPLRWSPTSRDVCVAQKIAFIPFGAGAFVCPARVAVAPMMIAILVGTMTMILADGWELRGERDGKEVYVNWHKLKGVPLPLGRGDLSDLTLFRARGEETSVEMREDSSLPC